MNQFTNLYAISKTLRLELIPQGKTLEFIEKNGLLSQDEHRAESYKKVKKIIDEFHKKFITNTLEKCQLKDSSEGGKDSLEEFLIYYKLPQKNDEKKKNLPEVQKNLRKQITRSFKDDERFNRLDKKELIKEDLLNFVDSEEDKELLKEFKDFTTYFTGFHENRKNMYSDEDKSTAIAYRLIHENLPRFVDNMSVFEKVAASPVKDNFPKILKELGSITQVLSIEEVFQLATFNKMLIQTGIDGYNHLIGGYTPQDGGKKIQGLNEYINLYNQTVSKNDRLPKLERLRKQILSDRVTASFIPEQYKSDQEVLDSIEAFYSLMQAEILNKKEDGMYNLKELLLSLPDYDLDGVFLKNDKSLTTISQKLFGDWSIIQKAVEKEFETNNSRKPRETEENYQKRKEKYLKSSDSFSIQYLDKCIALLELEKSKKIESYFHALGKTEENAEDVFQTIETLYEVVENLLNTPYSESKNLSQQKQDVENVKAFLDTFKELQWFIKPLLGKGDEANKDNNFYGEFGPIWDVLNDNLTPLYNKVRNYMTRKPYSVEKFKLNFENPDLLGGWPITREIATSGILFRNSRYYFLGILDKKDKRHFKNIPDSYDDNDSILKMEYLQAADPGKDVQNLMIINGKTVKKNGRKEKEGDFVGQNLILEDLKNKYLPEDINRIRKTQSYSRQSPNFNKNDLMKFIDYYMLRTIDYYCMYNFAFKKSNEYNNFKEFTDHVDQQAYQIQFRKISLQYINKMVEEGKLYLFKIYNKDFSPFSKGTPNLHTLYWKMLFDSENLKNVVYKLNGQAEVFFRKSSIKRENRIIHQANKAIVNKNENNEKKESSFDYDIIKDKRFTVDKFQFHVSITMNFKADGVSKFNEKVNIYLEENKQDIKYIGVDRGERHLLYYSVIDSRGKILEQGSLNKIRTEYSANSSTIEKETDYHSLLSVKEKERDAARKSWSTIENIKELKSGYLSHVVHKLATLMIKHNAVVILEDLNFGFKRGRFKIEKQVYQKFEKALIQKLNYLVFKGETSGRPGHLLNAYQLTEEFVSFDKLGKQSGFLFYVPAAYTSKIDPATGFVNLFDLYYKNISSSKDFFNKFDSIKYNGIYFEFTFDYENFTDRAPGNTKWTICTHGKERYAFDPKTKKSKECDVTEELRDLFAKNNIEFADEDDLKKQISEQVTAEFFKSLYFYMRLVLQMRYTYKDNEREEDYILSPVAVEGKFFDSRNAKADMPLDADANGAYHIALKGLMTVNDIKDGKLATIEKGMMNKKWFQFVQNKTKSVQ